MPSGTLPATPGVLEKTGATFFPAQSTVAIDRHFDEPMARLRDSVEPIESYTIITTDANPLVAGLHDRMPVILAERDRDTWLDPKNDNTDELRKLLRPYPAEEMRSYPVGLRVNSVKNDGPELIQPV